MGYGVIYKATNLVNGKIYIGQTTMKIKDRIYQHIHKAKNKERYNINTVFFNAIRKYGDENFKWEIIDKAKSRDEINKKEMYWINFYRSCVWFDDCNGYNMTFGGEGCTGIKPSKETIDRKSGINSRNARMSMDKIKEMISLASTGVYSYDTLKDIFGVKRDVISGILNKKTYKKETDAIISNDELLDIKNKVLDCGEKERRIKVGNGNKNKIVSKESIEKRINAYYELEWEKEVLQIDIKTKEIISIFQNLKEAEGSTGCKRSNISACCTRRQKSTGGFIWRYKDDYDKNEIETPNPTRKEVSQFDMNGNFIASYNSYQEGADAVDGNPTSISRVCRGMYSQHKGFVWRDKGYDEFT